MKKILVSYYTQSGQLKNIVDNILEPISAHEEVQVFYHKIMPVNNFPFPWKKTQFFDAFPESVLQIPCELEPIDTKIVDEKYDLIILACQVWYLSPSIPINSFLKSAEAKKLFKNTPVITVTGCRNMWVMAQEKIKKLLFDINADLKGNIVLIDRHLNHISVITIVQWMFTGVKKKYLGVFPKPGVSEKDIKESVKFGHIILPYLLNNEYGKLQDELLKAGAVKIKPFLVSIDKRANLIFNKWANLIIKKGEAGNPKRRFLLKIFNYYLLFAIWFIAPIVFILFLLTYLPLYWKIKKDQKYYSSILLK